MNKTDILNENKVDVKKALEFWSDLESYNEGLKDYFESLPQKLNDLIQYATSADYENYGILAHSIKSEAKYLGFSNEAEVFLQHELAGKKQDVNFIKNNLDTLKNTINNIINILNKYFNAKQEEKPILLIADDSDIIINFISKNLNGEFTILKANTGKKAIEILKDNKNLYAILLDLNMPSGNGFTVLEYLKENELIENIPTVLITGDDSKKTIKKAFTYPILDVLNKPFTIENINRVLVSIKAVHEKNKPAD